MCCCNNKCNVGCGWNCGCNCGCVSWGNNNNNNNNNNSWCCRPNDWASCQFRRGYAAGFNAGYETGFGAVSYTHLDVYKRQKLKEMALPNCISGIFGVTELSLIHIWA